MTIAQQLRAINQESGPFVAALLSDDISHDDQITFALRLVDTAIAIKQRATSTGGLVVEGRVVDECSRQQPLPPGER